MADQKTDKNLPTVMYGGHFQGQHRESPGCFSSVVPAPANSSYPFRKNRGEEVVGSSSLLTTTLPGGTPESKAEKDSSERKVKISGEVKDYAQSSPKSDSPSVDALAAYSDQKLSVASQGITPIPRVFPQSHSKMSQLEPHDYSSSSKKNDKLSATGAMPTCNSPVIAHSMVSILSNRESSHPVNLTSSATNSSHLNLKPDLSMFAGFCAPVPSAAYPARTPGVSNLGGNVGFSGDRQILLPLGETPCNNLLSVVPMNLINSYSIQNQNAGGVIVPNSNVQPLAYRLIDGSDAYNMQCTSGLVGRSTSVKAGYHVPVPATNASYSSNSDANLNGLVSRSTAVKIGYHVPAQTTSSSYCNGSDANLGGIFHAPPVDTSRSYGELPLPQFYSQHSLPNPGTLNVINDCNREFPAESAKETATQSYKQLGERTISIDVASESSSSSYCETSIKMRENRQEGSENNNKGELPPISSKMSVAKESDHFPTVTPDKGDKKECSTAENIYPKKTAHIESVNKMFTSFSPLSEKLLGETGLPNKWKESGKISPNRHIRALEVDRPPTQPEEAQTLNGKMDEHISSKPKKSRKETVGPPESEHSWNISIPHDSFKHGDTSNEKRVAEETSAVELKKSKIEKRYVKMTALQIVDELEGNKTLMSEKENDICFPERKDVHYSSRQVKTCDDMPVNSLESGEELSELCNQKAAGIVPVTIVNSRFDRESASLRKLPPKKQYIREHRHLLQNNQ